MHWTRDALSLGGPAGPPFSVFARPARPAEVLEEGDAMRPGNDLAALIEPTLEAMGYELVRVALIGDNRPTLQVMADRADEAPMTVEDCAEISRALSALLDVEDPIAGSYTLEVSTPGIDRPLTREKDFARFAGHEAKIELALAREGRKRFRGPLIGARDGTVSIDTADGRVDLPFADIRSAKLVLTDALLAASSAQLAANECSAGPDAHDDIDIETEAEPEPALTKES